MRILKTAVVAVLAAVLAAGTVFAEELTTCQLKDLDLSIGIPADFYIFTRDLPEDAPVFAKTGTTKEKMTALMEPAGYYLDAFDAAVTTEIFVHKADDVFGDINQLSNEELILLADSFETESAKIGIPLGKPDFYNHRQTKFIRYRVQLYDTSEVLVYQLAYSTFFNGQGITVFLRSLTGSIEDAQEELLKKVVDSVYFESPPQDKTVLLSSEMQQRLFGNKNLSTYKKETSATVYNTVKILFAAASAVCICIVMVSRKKKKQKEEASVMRYMREKRREETSENSDNSEDEAKDGVKDEAEDGCKKNTFPLEQPSFCPKCGTEIGKTQRFCPKCGERLM